MKKPLSEAFPEYKLMTAYDCFSSLKWSYEKTEDGAKEIMCCGQNVTGGGWIGTEHFHCEKCSKGMQNMTCFLPAGNSTAGVVDLDEYEYPEDGAVWIPEKVW